MTQNRARFHSQLEDDLLRDVERLQLSAPAEHALQRVDPEEYELSDHFDVHGLQLGKQPYSDKHPFHKSYQKWAAKAEVVDTAHPVYKQYHAWLNKNKSKGKGGGQNEAQKKKNKKNKGGNGGQYAAYLELEKLKNGTEEQKKQYEEGIAGAKRVLADSLTYLKKQIGTHVPGFAEAATNWKVDVYEKAKSKFDADNAKEKKNRREYVNFETADHDQDPGDDGASDASTTSSASVNKAKPYFAAILAAFGEIGEGAPDFIIKKKIYRKDLPAVKTVVLTLLTKHYNAQKKIGSVSKELQALVEAATLYGKFAVNGDYKPPVSFDKFAHVA